MINKVTLIGNVGKDPEVNYLDSGQAVAKFSLATSESYKNKDGEKVVNTEWHNIVCWRQLAELAEKYIERGKQLYIEGKITYRKWEDKNGVEKWNTEIVANQIQFLGKKHDPIEKMETKSAPARAVDTEDDSLPF